MATSAQEIFELAIDLIDERNETTGLIVAADTREYKNRALSILNIIGGELFPYSDTFTVSEQGKRPILTPITDFTTAINIDDYICRSVMPYGLAAHLKMEEDPASAGFFQQRYEELRAGLARGLPAVSEDIEDLYGGIEYREFGWW